MGHIYGRMSLLTRSDRPHMFIKEMMLYIEYLTEEIRRISIGVAENAPSYFAEFKENLLTGIDYYRNLAEQFVEGKKKSFLDDLQAQKDVIEKIFANLSAELKADS